MPEVDQVQYFDDSIGEWKVKSQRLVEPLFAHGCAVTSLADGRHGILTVGGFRYENLPTVNKPYFLSNIVSYIISYRIICFSWT